MVTSFLVSLCQERLQCGRGVMIPHRYFCCRYVRFAQRNDPIESMSHERTMILCKVLSGSPAVHLRHPYLT